MSNRLESALGACEQGLPVRQADRFADAIHWTASRNYPVHRWFRYREGFSPALFTLLPRSSKRLDPFCGCGTTLLDSMQSGIPSFGVDLNPLAVFVARVKTAAYSRTDRTEYGEAASRIAARVERTNPAAGPDYHLFKKLFLEESMDTLLRLRAGLERTENERVRDLLKLTWLSIIEDSSSVFKEGNGLKYRNKRRHPGKYETIADSIWVPRHFGSSIRKFVLRRWTEKSAEVSHDLATIPTRKVARPVVWEGSSLNPGVLESLSGIDLCAFSPPYANRFDYFESFKMELWMGGFVKSQEDLIRLRHLSMRNNLASDRSADYETWSELEPFLDVMDPEASSVRMGIMQTLHGYFDDFRVLLQNIRPTLTRKGKVIVVVGNSSYASSIIPTDVLVARLARQEGLTVKSINVARPLHVSSQQRSKLGGLGRFMRESVVVLQNN